MKIYDVIVIGGGHAGIEASLAAARMGASTLLLTQNVDHIGQMSCNPAIGGVAKGHVVREIDALGGEMARNTMQLLFNLKCSRSVDCCLVPRAQCDKVLYQRRMKQQLEKHPNLDIQQAEGLASTLMARKSFRLKLSSAMFTKQKHLRFVAVPSCVV